MWTNVDHETMDLLNLWQAHFNGTAVITKLLHLLAFGWQSTLWPVSPWVLCGAPLLE